MTPEPPTAPAEPPSGPAEPPEPPVAPSPVRRRRAALVLAALLAVAVVALGVVLIVRGRLATAGPDGAVRGYFAALADEDAATALGYGTVPSGSRALLTDRVLAEQQRIAPLRGVTTEVVDRSGDRARVRVRYALAFAAGVQQVDATIGLHRDDGDWRLDRAAVPTELLVSQATQRATVLGTAVPTGPTLVFPGAAPVGFDTPYLQLEPSAGSISPGAGTSTVVDVEPSAAGRSAVLTAIRRTLENCLTAKASARCPLPSERTVPGSVRGTLTGNIDKDLDVGLTATAAGTLTVTGDAKVRGDYRSLAFDDALVVHRKASFTLPVDVRAYAVKPLVLDWQRP